MRVKNFDLGKYNRQTTMNPEAVVRFCTSNGYVLFFDLLLGTYSPAHHKSAVKKIERFVHDDQRVLRGLGLTNNAELDVPVICVMTPELPVYVHAALTCATQGTNFHVAPLANAIAILDRFFVYKRQKPANATLCSGATALEVVATTTSGVAINYVRPTNNDTTRRNQERPREIQFN